MEKKAIAYTADIIVGNNGEVIDREFQKARIKQYAEENGIEIIAWFEDEVYNEHLFSRSGLKQMVACDKKCEYVLVERVAAVSRKWVEVKALLAALGTKRRRMECVTTLWDCVSQMVRSHYRKPTLPYSVAACAVEQAQCESSSVNLVSEYGRSRRAEEKQTQGSETSSERKVNVRCARKAEVAGMRYRTA
ncbi:MAG: recombinase family protein [Deltaproteobacteria bacterium]|nr:recombinase family protein [Deltaproteobacteria bacterium]